jgi:outer membrane protein TolC
LNVTLRQPLLKAGWLSYNLADIHTAENNVALARASLEEEVADLVAAVETAYWNLTYATRKLAVQEEAYRETRTFLAMTEQRYQAGYQASELDVVSAKGQVETRKYELINAHVELLAARDTLLTHLNPPGDRTFFRGRQGPPGEAFRIEEIAVEPTTVPTFAPVEVNIDKALETAFRRRPMYLSYELQERNQEIEVDRRRNELWPRFDVVGEWNQHGLQEDVSRAWDELGTGRYYTWYVGLELELPLFMRAERARIREAEEALREISLRKRKFENSLVLDIVKAARDLRAAYWQVRTTASATEYAHKQLEGEKKRLASGTSTSYTVLLMQNDLLNRRLAQLQAVVSYKTALVHLDRAKGTLLSRYSIQVR